MPGAQPQILGNLVTMTNVARPASISHYNVQPMINIYASVDGRDLGGVSDDVDEAWRAQTEKGLPRGSHIVIRGQVETMKIRRSWAWASVWLARSCWRTC